MQSHPRVPFTIRIQQFEGPLDLLLHLIELNELEISRLSLMKITDQYLRYIQTAHELNFEVASEFLVMAATLIQWKSKALLPREDTPTAHEEDTLASPEELLRRMAELKKVQDVALRLQNRPLLGEDVFVRENKRPPIERLWKTMEITSLATSYQDMLRRMRKRKTILKKETVSISDKIKQFKDRIHLGEIKPFESLLGDSTHKAEVVVTLLSTLELCKLKKLRSHQEMEYAQIFIELIDEITSLELSLQSEFDLGTGPISERAEA